jgi:hypothetical protein
LREEVAEHPERHEQVEALVLGAAQVEEELGPPAVQTDPDRVPPRARNAGSTPPSLADPWAKPRLQGRRGGAEYIRRSGCISVAQP